MLCEQLVAALEAQLPGLSRVPTSSSCGFLRKGSSRFAYVYHTKTLPHIEVWCRGTPEELMGRASSLTIRPRSDQASGWNASFASRFTLSELRHVDEAVQLLVGISARAR